MKRFLVCLTVVLSIAVAGCERMKNVEWKVWEKWTKKDDSTEVIITNLTEGAYITRVLVVGHAQREGAMFEYGSPASEQLQAVAEGGNVDPMLEIYETEGGQVVFAPDSGLIGPGESATVALAKEHTRISLVGMILPTNDGFIALDNSLLREGEQLLYAIDAGTEANDERITGGGAPNTPGIPADPGGQADNNAPGISGLAAEGSVERHPGISGADGSALSPQIHGWSGPVASVTVVINSD